MNRINNKGNLEKISLIVVSSRVAARLFLEGVLGPDDFAKAKENVFNTVGFPFVEKGEVCSAITLHNIKFNEFAFEVCILSELKIDGGMIATLDKNYKVV